MTARVASIWRHPIKAHGRERLAEVDLAAGQTLPGDRAWAVLHEAGRATPGAWAACGNFTRGAGIPALMAIEAATLPDGRYAVAHPDRPPLEFDPAAEPDAFLAWVKPLIPGGRAAPVALVPASDRQGMTDASDPWISLFGLASHCEVATRLDQPDLSTQRWRANVVLDGLTPWEEFGWIGREVRIGHATLAVRETIGRCLATAANPATGVRDADTLGTLEAIHGERRFAVYAEVTTGGRVAEGDPVEPL